MKPATKTQLRSDKNATSTRGGTDLGYQPVALFYVFREKDEKFTPPPQVGIDTNLQFGIFQKKGTPTPRQVLIRIDIAGKNRNNTMFC